MNIRFYKNTLTESQIIELLKLDDNFKLDRPPIIEFRPNIHCDGSGYFDVFSKRRSRIYRTKSTFLRLTIGVLFNARQIELYEKFINESYRVKICPYWIVDSDNKKQLFIQMMGNFIDLNYEYPFIIGKEGSLTFQHQEMTINDFYDHEERTIYKYELQKF